MRHYTAISIIRAWGCSGHNKSADYSSVKSLDPGMKDKKQKMKQKETRKRVEARDLWKKRQRRGCADTHVFHWTEIGMGLAVNWQVSMTFVRPTYQLLS